MEMDSYYTTMDEQGLVSRPPAFSEASGESPLHSPGSSGSTGIEFEDKENVESDNASVTSQGSSTRGSRRYGRSFGSSQKGKAEPKRWAPEEDERLRSAIDEYGECNWKAIAKRVGSRTHVQCLQRWKKVLKPGLIKGQWGQDEDQMLTMLVQKGFKNWGHLAAHMPGRTSKQCRERWCHHLDPSINRGDYSKTEDETILRLQRELGNRWADIASALDGRTENAVKSRWKALVRMQKTKRAQEARGEKMEDADDELSMCSGSPRGSKQQRHAGSMRDRAPSMDADGFGLGSQCMNPTPAQLTNAQRALLGLPSQPSTGSPAAPAYTKPPSSSTAPYGFYSPLDQTSLLATAACLRPSSVPAPPPARAAPSSGGGLLLLDPNNMRYDSSSCQASTSTAYPPRYSTHGTYLAPSNHYQASTTTPATSLDILAPSSAPSSTQAAQPSMYQGPSTNTTSSYAASQGPAYGRELSQQSRSSSQSWGWNLDALLPDGSYSRLPSFNDQQQSSMAYTSSQASQPQATTQPADLLSLLRNAPQPSRSSYFEGPSTSAYDYTQAANTSNALSACTLPTSSSLPLYTTAIPPPTPSIPLPRQTYDSAPSRQTYDSTPSRPVYDSAPSRPVYDSAPSRQTYDSAPSRQAYEPTNGRSAYDAGTASMPSRQSYSDFWYATHDMLSNAPAPEAPPAPASRQSSSSSLHAAAPLDDGAPTSRRDNSTSGLAAYASAANAFPHLATNYLNSSSSEPPRYTTGQAPLPAARMRAWELPSEAGTAINPFAY